MDWTNIKLDPGTIEMILSVGLPAVLALALVVMGLFGLDKTIEQIKSIWRQFRPLVDEATDPLFILTAAVTHLTPEQLEKIRREIDKQLDGEEAAPLAERGG